MPEVGTQAAAGGATLTVLGAGSILPRAGYGSSGYALRGRPGGAVTLLDCGPGTLRSLAERGVELGEVERVIVSHFHTDHVLDLFALAFARRNPAFDPPPLEIVGPTGIRALLERGAEALGRWVRFERTSVVEVEGARQPRALDCSLGRLSWVLTEHAPEALAWRVDLPGGESLAYSGDTGERAQVAALSAGAGLFLCECSFPEEAAVPEHLTPTGAARLASAAGVGRLILTHFYPSMDPLVAAERAAEHYSGPIETARDGSLHPLRVVGAPATRTHT